MAQPATRRLAAWSAAAIFLGAFLLFQVQPIISKMILPWFGGSPAVWTTAMLFFQTLLLAGYLYAHWAARLPPRWAAGLHTLLLLVAVAMLPITPSDSWKPLDGAQPVARILALLAACVGLPYLLLSATSPLVQAWLARASADRSVYRLYSLSNIGSLGALLSYPILVEPALSTHGQGWLWSGGLVAYALVCAALTATLWKSGIAAVREPSLLAKDATAPQAEPTWRERLIWVAAPALASTMLLAVTQHLCQDIAVVPFLWIAPLSLYLVTFIVAFDRDAWYSRQVCAAATFGFVLVLSLLDRATEIQEYYHSLGIELPLRLISQSAFVQSFVHLGFLFFLCMLCHGETVRSRPAPRWLTSFYLSLSAGGALGGVLSALVFPRIFHGYWELRLGVVAALLLSMAMLAWDYFQRIRREKLREPQNDAAPPPPANQVRRHKQPKRRKRDEAPVAVAEQQVAATASAEGSRRLTIGLGVAVGLVGLFVVGWAQVKAIFSPALARERNFYGVLSVVELFEDEPAYHGRALYHGRIMHGYQLLEQGKRSQPTAYFHEKSGIGRLMRNFPRQPRRIGIIGLGAGALATYAEPGDVVRYYEINPLVIEYAHKYFTFLEDCPAKTLDVVSGDARIAMEAEKPQEYDLLVIDAFSGDAIPTHLLTREAMELYQRHLRRDGQGTLAFHISNRYLELRPVVAALAEAADCQSLLVTETTTDRLLYAPSDWAIVTRDPKVLNLSALRSVAQPLLPGDAEPILWTDRQSNLLGVLR